MAGDVCVWSVTLVTLTSAPLAGFNPLTEWDLCVVLFIFNGATADDSKIQAITFWTDSCTGAVGQASCVSL